jgi:hypothetical protein
MCRPFPKGDYIAEVIEADLQKAGSGTAFLNVIFVCLEVHIKVIQLSTAITLPTKPGGS